MMKRILPLLLALCLLLGLVPAAAEAMPENLYRIVLRTDSGDETLGTAVLYGSQATLLTAAGCWAEGDLYAIGADGEHAILRCDVVIGTQLISMAMATPSSAEPMPVSAADYLLDYCLYGVNAGGGFVRMDVYNSRVTRLDGRTEVLLYAAEGLLPGAIMMGDDFGLACVTVHQAAEGEGVYAAVTDVTLGKLDTRPANGTFLLTGFTARYEAGHVVVDWSDVALPENVSLTVFSTSTNNIYLTSLVPAKGATSVVFPAAPGTEVMSWIAVTPGGAEMTGQPFPETVDEAAFVDVPLAGPITFNGLRSIRMGVTTGEPGAEAMPADFLPQEPLTRENLTGRSLYFMTEDTYTCTAEDDDHTLMVILYTPEGYTFYYYSGYVFMPEFADSDLWIADISDLAADYERFCAGEPWPAGEYTVLFTIDGAEVSRMTFTLD